MKAIETRVIPATDTKPARIVASDLDGNRIVLGANSTGWGRSDERAHKHVAEHLRDKMGWKGRLKGGATKRGYAFVFLT